MLTKIQKIALEKLRGCIQVTNKYTDDRPMNHHCFGILLLVAIEPGITRNEINLVMDESVTTTNHYIADLGRYKQ